MKRTGKINYNIDREMRFLNNKTIKEAVLKISASLLIVCFSWNSLSAVVETMSYFNDTESSSGNFSAGSLDFYLSSDSDFSPDQINIGENSIRDVKVVDSGILPFRYGVSSLKTGGDDALCSALLIEAKFGLEIKYSGSLEGLAVESILISDTGEDSWSFTVNLPEDPSPELQSKSCQFNLIFNGWQDNFLVGPFGFSDVEEIENNISTGVWGPDVTVTYPNGGEVWYLLPPGYARPGLGQYDITWTASSPVYEPLQLLIDIWYCKNSGENCFYQIASATENDGVHTWTIPYDSSFVSHEARIKIKATDPLGSWDEDMSDADFCPPMLSPFEAMQLVYMLNQENAESSDSEPEIELPESIVEVVTPSVNETVEIQPEALAEEPVFEEPAVVEDAVTEEEPAETSDEEQTIIEETTIEESVIAEESEEEPTQESADEEQAVIEEAIIEEPAEEPTETEELEQAVAQETTIEEPVIVEEPEETEEAPNLEEPENNENQNEQENI